MSLEKSYALDYKELADHLGYAPETIKKVWRSYPHYFAGSGKTLKSARFDLQDVLSYLKDRDYANIQVQNQGGDQVQGQLQTSRPASHTSGVQPKTGSKSLDSRRKAQAGNRDPDKWRLFRFGNGIS